MSALRPIPVFPVILLLLACGLWGCGSAKSRNLPKSPVAGEVTFNGQHLPDGQIVFVHESGDMASANFKGDGKYTASVAQGKNQVMVKSVVITGGQEGPNRARSMEIQTSRIPEKYLTPALSGLECVVTAGKNEYNVALKSK
ncbi:MAG: hypothetical protein JWN70_1763 [Planctomycetaceae bacterium]|nr:hypothetical protein [Planctomycetaceae bacterium]